MTKSLFYAVENRFSGLVPKSPFSGAHQSLLGPQLGDSAGFSMSRLRARSNTSGSLMSKPFCAPSNVEIENHERNGKAERVRISDDEDRRGSDSQHAAAIIQFPLHLTSVTVFKGDEHGIESKNDR